MTWLDTLLNGVKYVLTNPFGYTGDPNYHNGVHTGVDLAIPQGTPLYAPIGGHVTFAGLGDIGPGIGTVSITGLDGTVYKVGHLSAWGVSAGQWVDAGKLIGLSGGEENTFGAGYSTGPHVHLEKWIGGEPVDPMSNLAGGTSGGVLPGGVLPGATQGPGAMGFSLTDQGPAAAFLVLGVALVAIGTLSIAGVI